MKYCLISLCLLFTACSPKMIKGINQTEKMVLDAKERIYVFPSGENSIIDKADYKGQIEIKTSIFRGGSIKTVKEAKRQARFANANVIKHTQKSHSKAINRNFQADLYYNEDLLTETSFNENNAPAKIYFYRKRNFIEGAIPFTVYETKGDAISLKNNSQYLYKTKYFKDLTLCSIPWRNCLKVQILPGEEYFVKIKKNYFSKARAEIMDKETGKREIEKIKNTQESHNL